MLGLKSASAVLALFIFRWEKMKIIKEVGLSIIGILVITVLILAGMGFFKNNPSSEPNDAKNTSSSPTTKVQKKVDILALGDSLTQGVGDLKDQNGYQQRLAKNISKKSEIKKVQVYNEGISGERSDQILARLKKSSKIQKEVSKSEILIVTAGGNDLFQKLQKDATDSTSQITVNVNKASLEYQKNLQEIFKIARKINPKIKIAMVGVYNPFFVYFPNVTAITNAITTFNATAQATTDYFTNAVFVDINALSVGQYKTSSQQSKLAKESTEDDIAVVEKSQLEQKQFDTKEKNNYLSDADHFHPNNKGYDMMTDKIYKGLNKAGFLK